MLNLIFQIAKAKNPKSVVPDCRIFFDMFKEDSWFTEQFVRDVIKDIDGAEVITGSILKSREGKTIPSDYLSTGAKAVICAWRFPDRIFNITQMGDNALKYILELSKERDMTILVYREILYSLLDPIGFTKDYEPVYYEDDIEYYELFDKWLEEIYND